jgi:hypothetical protein
MALALATRTQTLTSSAPGKDRTPPARPASGPAPGVSLLVEPGVQDIPFTGSSLPPTLARLAGGLSGRRFCRIYPQEKLWVLEFEPASAWVESDCPDSEEQRLTFPSLAAAIGYAVRHGLDYRVTPRQPYRTRWQERGRPDRKLH